MSTKYFIDEAHACGEASSFKLANCSVSMVHHYCQTFSQGGGGCSRGKGPLNETYGYLCGQLCSVLCVCGLFYKNICVGAGIPVACKLQFSILEL